MALKRNDANNLSSTLAASPLNSRDVNSEGTVFGLGKVDGLSRREYNSRVRDLLEQRMGIETDNTTNPLFPGLLRFGQLLDMAWRNKLCSEEAALALALSYLTGCAKSGSDGVKEATQIFEPISAFLVAFGMTAKIPEERCRRFAMQLDEVSWLLPNSR